MTVETLALRQAIEHGDLAWESRLLAAHHTLASVPTTDEDGTISAEWLVAHARFHEALGEGGPNVRLNRLADSLRDVAYLMTHCGCSAVDADQVAVAQAVVVGMPCATASCTEAASRTCRRDREARAVGPGTGRS